MIDKKAFYCRIISLVASGIFFLNYTAYGKDLSKNTYLRIPIGKDLERVIDVIQNNQRDSEEAELDNAHHFLSAPELLDIVCNTTKSRNERIKANTLLSKKAKVDLSLQIELRDIALDERTNDDVRAMVLTSYVVVFEGTGDKGAIDTLDKLKEDKNINVAKLSKWGLRKIRRGTKATNRTSGELAKIDELSEQRIGLVGNRQGL